MKFEIDFSHMPEYVVVRTEGKATVPDFDATLSKQSVAHPVTALHFFTLYYPSFLNTMVSSSHL